MAGVYAYTPLGLRVLENIKQIVREEMNAINSQELIMSELAAAQKCGSRPVAGAMDCRCLV